MEPLRIQTEDHRNVPNLLVAQLLAVLVKQVAEFPKFALPVSRNSSDRRLAGILVASERKVFMNHFDFLRVLLEHRLEYRYQPGTRRSLKVTEHGDHHRCFDGSLERT